MGPLISAGQRETVASFVPDGAPVAIRGSAPDGPGYWFPPTVLCPVDPGDRAVREEIFGPVAVVIPFRDEAEAVALANDTIYGLSGSIWTRDGAKALRVARAARDRRDLDQLEHVGAGLDAVRRLQAVGRTAASSGRTRSTHYTEVKTVYYATGAMSRLDGQGLRHHRRRGRHRRRRPSQRFQDEGATVVGVDLRDDAPGRPRARVRRHRRGRGPRAVRARARGVRAHRRAVQQRRHLARPTTPRCSTPRSRRGSACRTSTSSRSSSAASTASRTCSRPAAARSSTPPRSWR